MLFYILACYHTPNTDLAPRIINALGRLISRNWYPGALLNFQGNFRKSARFPVESICAKHVPGREKEQNRPKQHSEAAVLVLRLSPRAKLANKSQNSIKSIVMEIFQLSISDETHLKRLKRLEIYGKFQSPVQERAPRGQISREISRYWKWADMSDFQKNF